MIPAPAFGAVLVRHLRSRPHFLKPFLTFPATEKICVLVFIRDLDILRITVRTFGIYINLCVWHLSHHHEGTDLTGAILQVIVINAVIVSSPDMIYPVAGDQLFHVPVLFVGHAGSSPLVNGTQLGFSS